jgi:hemoglobin-like flavoprotein
MDITQSLERIFQSQDTFGRAFYEVLLGRRPELRDFFSDVDMDRQAVLLTMALAVVERHHRRPNPTTEKYLRYLGAKHRDRAVPPELYPQWADAMMESLARFHGDDWSDSLAAEWKESIDRAINPMLRGYSESTRI